MRRHAQIAVAALISISAGSLPAYAQHSRKSVAMIPGMVPAAAPHPVSVRSSAVSRTQFKRLANSSYPANHFQRGLLLKQQGQEDKALVEFLKAAQENPYQVKAYYEQAVIFKQRGYNKLATSALQQALTVNPDFRDARVLLASIHLENGALSEAAQELFRSLGLNPRAKIAGSKQAPGPGQRAMAGPPLSSATSSSLPIMQTPHGHIFSPLSAVSKPPKNTNSSGNVNAAAVADRQVDAFSSSGRSADSSSQQQAPSGRTSGNGRGSASGVATDNLAELLKGIPGDFPSAAPAAEEQASPLSEASRPAAAAVATSGSGGSDRDESIRRQVEAMRGIAKPEADSGFHFPSMFGFFKGAAAPPPHPEGSSTTVTPAPTSPQASAQGQKHVQDMIEAAHYGAKKNRVAGWMGSLGADHFTRKRSSKSNLGLSTASSRKKGNLNPVEMLMRQGASPSTLRGAQSSKVSVTESLPEGIAPGSGQQSDGTKTASALEANEQLPPTGKRIQTITTSTTADGLSMRTIGGAPSDSEGGWFPSPVDFSKFWHKAMSWMPPMFQSSDAPSTAPLPAPLLTPSGYPAAPSPNAVTDSSAAASFQHSPDLLPPQSKSTDYSAQAIPSTLPQPEKQHGVDLADASNAVPQARPQNGLDSVLSFLPKDLAAGLEQVLSPKPVDIAAESPSTPKLQEVSVARPGPGRAPAPVQSADPEKFDNLVSAQVGPAAIAETELASAALAVAPSRSNRPVVSPATPAPSKSFGRTAPEPELNPMEAIQSAWQFAPTAAPSLAHAPLPSDGGTQSLPQSPVSWRRNGNSLPVPPPPAGAAPAVNMYNAPASKATDDRMQKAPLQYSRRDSQSDYAPEPVEVAMAGGSAPSLAPHRVGKTSRIAAPSPINSVPARARPVAQRLENQGFKFVTPNLPSKQQSFVNSLHTAAKPYKAMTPVIAPVPPPEDEWTQRMRYLVANGTQNLNNGEAFMFSEESGEGVLFLSDGTTIRRKLAGTRDALEVAKARRPDILAPKGDLQYNLSLLGKIVKPATKGAPAARATGAATSGPVKAAPNLTVDEILDKSDGILGWLKGVFKL